MYENPQSPRTISIMLKRLAPALVLALGAALLLIPATAPAATTGAVGINGYNYTPLTIKVQQGGTVTWTNNNSLMAHTATSIRVQGFWDSKDIAAGGGTFSETNTFLNAGTYVYHCTIHSFMAAGKVQVPMKATGTSSTGYTLQWSSLPAAPTDRTFDVWIKRPGSTKFVVWKTATTKLKSALFNPSTAGKYSFEARTNIVGTARHSDWSPVLTITIT
jgi:plastocyanin